MNKKVIEISSRELRKILIKNNPKIIFWIILHEIPFQIQRLKIKYKIWKKNNANRTN